MTDTPTPPTPPPAPIQLLSAQQGMTLLHRAHALLGYAEAHFLNNADHLAYGPFNVLEAQLRDLAVAEEVPAHTRSRVLYLATSFLSLYAERLQDHLRMEAANGGPLPLPPWTPDDTHAILADADMVYPYDGLEAAEAPAAIIEEAAKP